MSSSTLASPGPAARAGSPPISTGWALLALSLAILLCQLDTSIVNVGLPTLMRVFQAGFDAVQWVVLSYLLAVTGLIVGAGRLGDWLGKKRLFLIGLAVFTLASAACGAAPGLGFLVAARAVQGLGAAVLVALGFAFVGDVAPRSRVGRAMGVLGAMSSLGTTLGPTLGGITISYLGWRAMFFLNVPLCAVAYLVARRHLPEAVARPAAPRRRSFDWPGSLMLAGTLGAYSMAMTYSQPRGFGDRAVVLLLLGAAVGLAGFVARQARAAEPLLALSLLREPLLCTGLAMSALVTTVMMSTLVLGPFFLARALGLSAREVGLVMSAGPLVAALSAIPAGRVVDRIGARRTAAAGLVVFTLGALGMSLLTPAQGIHGYVLRMVIICAGYGFFQTPNNTAVMAGAPPDQRGLASSLLALARNFGGITGGSLMGTIFATAIRTPGPSAAGVAGASADAIARGMQTTFRVAAALGLCALLLAVLPPFRRPAETKAA